MLQDRAKITIELDLEGAKRQLEDAKKGLESTTKLTTHLVEETTKKVKEDEKKEVERQRSSLAEKLRRITEMPRRMLAPDIPGEVIGAGIAAIPVVGPPAGRMATLTWREAENMKIAMEIISKIDIPGLKEFGKMVEESEKYTGSIDKLIELKAKWEAIGKTLEDTVAALSGSLATGKAPSGEGTSTFISRLYEYNAAMGALTKNKRILLQSMVGSTVIDTLVRAVRGK